MEAAEEIVDENPWNTDARTDRDSTHQTAKSENQEEQEKVVSIDKVRVEKIVLESAGSREVLLTKNETSLKRKLSIKSESGKPAFTRSKTNESADSSKFRASLPEDILAPNSTDICNDAPSKENTESTIIEKRIKPVKLSKSPSIGSIAISLKNLTPAKISRKDWPKDELVADRSENKRKNEPSGKIEEKEERDKDTKEHKDNEIAEIDAKNRLEKSQTNIEVLQQNLNTKIDANTAQKYKKKLLESRENRALKLSDAEPSEKLASKITFDEEFLQKHNLDKRLKIEEYGLLDVNRESVSTVEEESDSRKRPIYSEKVLEVEKRWSGEFLKNQLDRHSSESSKSSYVEELGSVSSRESEDYDPQTPLFDQRKRRPEFERSIDLPGNRTCEEILADSTLSTVDSDSCLEDRIKSLDEDIREKENERIEDDSDNVEVDRRKEIELEASNLWNESVYLLSKEFWNPRNETAKSFTEQPRIESEKISSSTNTDSIDFALVRDSCKTDGYANLIREFTMEAGTSSRTKKEEKQKKKLGLRRLLPGFFSPKDSRKDYKKKESKERKRPDDRHFARYQQNGNYTRSPDTMNLNEDIKRNVKLDNSLNGSIIEERLDEIKRELFPDQGPITSTPDHLARDEDHEGLLRDRSGAPRSYTTDSSLSSIAPDERWNERNAQLGISPDIRKFEQRQKREEFNQRYGQRYGQLERKHSLQEPNHASRAPYFFQRNHAPSGRISAPPSERYLVRPRAIHPMDRPLPAIPHSRTELANYENYLEEQEERQEQIARYGKNSYDKPPEYLNEPGLYENDNPPGLILKSVSAQVKITRQPIVNQNHRAPLVGRSPKYLSSGSSQKSGDYGDSSCTPNSSQKSEFSPSSSKSGEYYLHSPRNSGSPNGREFDEEDCRREGIYENEKSPSRSSTRCMDERIYDETPASPSPCQENSANAKQLDRSIEDSLDKRVSPSQRSRSRGERSVSPRENLANEKREDERQAVEANNREESNRGPTSPSGSQGKPISPFGSRQRLPASRRAQPNEQILIASPKRETTCETRIPRPSNDSRRCAIESPVHMTNTPRKLVNVNCVDQRNQDSSPSKDAAMTKGAAGANGNFNTEIPRPEPIYGYKSQRNAVVSSPRIHSPENINHRSDNVTRNDGDDRVAWVQAHASSPQASPQQPSEAHTSPLKEVQPNTQKSVHLTESGSKENHHHREQTHHSQNAVASRQVEIQLARNANRVGVEEQSVSQQQESRPETMYVQKICELMYGQRGTLNINSSGPLSPSKQKTRQHLEAFYWQQKALEAHRKSLASPVSASSRQMARKIDLPEVREAVYWQQLKKLDEEQQRRIYEQNLMEESSYCKKNAVRTSTPRQTAIRSPTSVAVPVAHGNPASWSAGNLRCAKSNPIGKPPLMQSQKGQNQPVLIVRPQQAIRDRRDLVPSKPLEPARQEAQRSKSASPHFHRGEAQVVPRKLEVSSIYEQEANDVDGKTVAPPPIFKRGSLIGGESVEYGTAGGAKRVSFSNQSAVGQDLASGSWPTKHGTAPEPPTRRHRSEDSVSDSDSVFLHQERRDVNCLDGTEYDADRPLPPLPKDVASGARSVSTAGPGPARSVAYGEVRWNSGNDPRRAVSPQRVLQQKEEEWNSDGKGRQSNDIGGSGRGEGEAGSNEVATGRRGGSGGGVGSGVGGGGGGGGSVLGVGGGGSVGGGSGGRSGSGGGGRSRDEPRRHTLGGDHQPSLHHQQFNAAQQLHPLHPHHLPPPHGQYGTPPTRHTTMDLEMGTKSRQRKSPLPRGYPPPSSTMLFDDDPGIMSEVETSSTGFRRGGKQRSSLPVVRTPSKTLERPLGLVFLQYRNETKRALLPNEITSIDTVKALFVRSFPKQLTMEYLDSPHVKVYIHDSNKDMFYELEDLRSHLRDIRDRSVLRLFESTDGVTGMPGPLGIPGTGTGLPPHWEDQSYFSEPEFDSEYQHQHIHKSKTAKNSTSGNSGYYVGGSSTLPRGGQLMRAYSPAASSVVGGPNATPTQPKPLATPDRLHGESGYMSSPERGGGVGSGTGRYPPGPYSAGSSYEDPYYSQYSGTVTPVIDEEARIRVEHMERQLANLTGLVQKALTHAPHTSPSPRDYLQVPAGRDPYARGPERDRHKPTPPPKPAALVAGQYVYRDMALTPEMYNQLRGLQKKAKDLRQEVRNLRRMSQAQAHTIRETILDTFITIRTMLLSCGDAAWDAEKIRLSREEDLYRQEMLRLVKDLTELENTVEELRGNVINRKTRVNMSDVENMALIMSKSSKTVADLKVRFPSLQEGMKGLLSSEMEMVVRAEKFLKEEPERLESALKRCKKLTSTLVTLKRLASVQEQRLPNAAASVDAEETPPITPTSAQHSKAAAPVPAERTVVGSASVIGGGPHPHEPPATHQQRPENALDALLDELQTFSRPSSQLGHAQGSSTMLSELGRSGSRGEAVGASTVATTGRPPCISDIGRKGSVDSSSGTLLPSGGTLAPAAGPPNAGGTLRRLHSYPSSSDTDTSPPIARLQVSLQEQPSLPTLPQGFVPGQKPPVPERNAELLQLASARRVPPPPPPRTSSRSPLASPTSPQLPPRNHSYNLQSANATLRRPPARGTLPVKEGKPPMALPTEQPVATLESTAPSPVLHNNSTSSQSSAVLSTSNSSSCESVNSQEGLQSKKGRQEQLEQRHQELLRKQKALQEQYARLQQLQRNTAGLTTIPPAPPDLLKKTGSESNLLAKMGLGLSTASSGSLTSLTAAKQSSVTQEIVSVDGVRARQEESNEQQRMANCSVAPNVIATTSSGESNGSQTAIVACNTSAANVSAVASTTCSTASTTATTTTSKIYETDIL